jgi:hypothetical protein
VGSLRNLKKTGKKPPEHEELTEQDIMDTLTPPEDRKYEKLDDLEVVADDRRRGRQAVSINGVMGRIVLYAGSYDAMCAGAKQKVEHVQLKMSPRFPKMFWICPCSQKEIGARHIHTTGKTMLLSAKALIDRLGLKNQKTARYDAEWDSANQGLVVDLRRSI